MLRNLASTWAQLNAAGILLVPRLLEREFHNQARFKMNLGVRFDPGDAAPISLLKSRLEWDWAVIRGREPALHVEIQISYLASERGLPGFLIIGEIALRA